MNSIDPQINKVIWLENFQSYQSLDAVCNLFAWLATNTCYNRTADECNRINRLIRFICLSVWNLSINNTEINFLVIGYDRLLRITNINRCLNVIHFAFYRLVDFIILQIFSDEKSNFVQLVSLKVNRRNCQIKFLLHILYIKQMPTFNSTFSNDV